MQRDMDMIRDLLMEIADNQAINGRYLLSDGDFGVRNEDRSKVQYHLRLMIDAELIEGRDQHSLADLERLLDEPVPRFRADDKGNTLRNVLEGMDHPIHVTRMTWKGHDFLDTVKDDKVWDHTKGVLEGLKGVGFDTIKDVASAVAKGFIKTQLKKYTGIELDYKL
jgi:hypothetical protein